MDGPGGDIIEQAIRLLLSWGAIPWWAILLLALGLSLWIVGKARGWWKLTDPGVDPARNDAPAAPTDADSSWQTDPDHPGGDNVGGA